MALLIYPKGWLRVSGQKQTRLPDGQVCHCGSAIVLKNVRWAKNKKHQVGMSACLSGRQVGFLFLSFFFQFATSFLTAVRWDRHTLPTSFGFSVGSRGLAMCVAVKRGLFIFLPFFIFNIRLCCHAQPFFCFFYGYLPIH